ncbi:MAG: hypothetical protein ACRDPV_04575 [Gaiellaceae bacterium]
MSSTTAAARYPNSIAATWLAARLAIDPAKIDLMRRSGDLIAVREPGSVEWLYPAWQLDSGKPRRGIARVVAAAREAGLDETRLYDVLTAPLGMRESGRKRLVDLLLEGREDEVVAAVRAAT